MERATIHTSPSTSLSGILLLSEPNIPEAPEYEKISTLNRCTGRSHVPGSKLATPLGSLAPTEVLHCSAVGIYRYLIL